MLILYDAEHNKLCGLDAYDDAYVEYAVGNSTTPIQLDQLHFKYPMEDSLNALIGYECYIECEGVEYVVKEQNLQTATDGAITWVEYVCDLNVEGIKGTLIDSYAPGSAQAEDAVNLALAGTEWSVIYSDVTKTRTVAALTNTTAWDALSAAASMYNCDVRFDTARKGVILQQKTGTDRGAYLAEQLNLKSLQVQGNSRDYVTRLYPIGKDGMTIASANDGVNYVSNYQYSAKVISAYWVDNRYTIAADMLADVQERLDYLSKPTRAYSAYIIDLANASGGKYNLLDFEIGDTITLIAESVGIREQQRIIKIDRYIDKPEQSTCEIANRIASLDDIILRVSDAADTVSASTDADGNVLGSSVSVTNSDGTFDPLNVALAKIGTAIIGKLDADAASITYATIANLDALNETVTGKFTAYDGQFQTIETNSETVNGTLTALDTRTKSLETDKLSATDAELIYAKIDLSNIGQATIQTAMISNGAITNAKIGDEAVGTSSIQQAAITQALIANGAVGTEQVANDAIGDAQIASCSIGKLLAGVISTDKFTVASDSGNLSISNSTVHVWDTNGKERVSLGLNGSDYNLLVRAADGQTTMFGADGVTNAGITSGAVDDSKVAANANINGSKIDQESLVSRINGATTLVQSSRIQYDPTGQTLNVAFNNVSTTANTASANASNAVSTANAAASNASSAVTTANSASSTASTAASNASSAVSTANTANSNASSAVSTANSASSTASSALSTANSAQSAVTALSQTVASQGTSIGTMQGQISTKIWQTDITTAINAVQIGGTNYVQSADYDMSNNWTRVNSSGFSSIAYSGYVSTVNLLGTSGWEHLYRQFNVVSGQTYTFGFDYTLSATNGSGYFYVLASNTSPVVTSNNISGNLGNVQVNVTASTASKTRMYFTFVATASTVYLDFSFGNMPDGVAFTMLLGNFKLESGNKATDWSPAPEDVQGQISTINTTITSQQSSLTQLQNSIDACVTSSTFNTYTSNTNGSISALQSRMSSAEQKITSDAIISTVTSSTSWSNMSGTVSTASSNASNAVSTANSASGTANTAASNASTALSTAQNAASTANSASSNASSAVSTANSANGTASSALSTASTAYTTATSVSNALASPNLCSPKSGTYTSDGVTCTVADDGTITFNGTPSSANKALFSIPLNASMIKSSSQTITYTLFKISGSDNCQTTFTPSALTGGAHDAWAGSPITVSDGNSYTSNNIVVWIRASGGFSNWAVRFEWENGSVSTPWVQSTAGTQANIAAAQTTANTAVTNASSAQTTANSAVTAAATAQTTANSKSRNFTSTPTVPYYVGDTWTNPSGDVMVCNTARATGSYTASDWGYASSVTTSTITQLSTSIGLKVSSGDVTNMLNVDTSGIQINAANIDINGLVTQLNTKALYAQRISTTGSSVYGTIGDISSDGITGFVLRQTSDNSNLLRIASGPYGDDGSNATIMDVNGPLTIKSDISSNTEASLFLYDEFNVQTTSGASLALGYDTFNLSLHSGSYWAGVNPSGGRYLTIPLVKSDGVMEIGYAVDFHYGTGNTSDFTARLSADSGGGLNASGSINATGFYNSNLRMWGVCSSDISQFSYGNNALNWIIAGGGSYYVYQSGSDERLKSNIVPSSVDALNTLRALHIIDYTYSEDGSHVMCGVSAQDLQSHDALFAHVFMTRDGVDYLAPNWDAINPWTIKAVQQLAGKSDDTDAKIDALKSENDSLRSVIASLQERIDALNDRIAALEGKVA